MKINYNNLVPTDTFISRYLSFMAEQETPISYDFWSAIWAIGNVCGREVFVERPRAPVYLNWFLVLVAESGITRKSTSVRVISKIVRDVFRAEKTNELFIDTKCSPEQLEFMLSKSSTEYGKAHATISISELATFLGKERYVASMPTLLTDLYDAPELRMGGGTIARGTSVMRNVFVSFLSASTPSWLLRAINPDVIEGGFTSRVMFVVADKGKKKVAWPIEGDNNEKESLIAQLSGIRKQAKRYKSIRISENAKRKFTVWYNNRKQSTDAYRNTFESREDSHILRVASCLCINDGTYIIHSKHLTTAIKLVTQAKEDGSSIFVGGKVTNKIATGIDRIRELLLQAGTSGMQQSAITKKLKNIIDAEMCRSILDVMHNLEMVQLFEGVQMGVGRPVNIWRATKNIMVNKSSDLILDKLNV